MLKPLRDFVLGMLLLLTAGCVPYLVVSGGAVNPERLRDIKSGLAAMRGLEFKADVPIEVTSEAELKRYFVAELDRQYGEEKLKQLALVYGKLGLFPENFDLQRAVAEFYGSQVAAFYDPRAKKLFLPRDLGGGAGVGLVQFFSQRDIMGEMVLAHELTHALQDQHFSLANRLAPSNNDDRSLAFRAVAEGDATLSGFGYVFDGLDETNLPQVNGAVRKSITEARFQLTDIPEAILEELLFQYYGGVAFVSRVLERRGWLGVSYLYRYPPISTEQILHPERFFDAPDPPLRITLSDPATFLSAAWHEIENNVLGELMVRTLFRRFVSEERAKTVAEGWGGDRLVAYRLGDQIALIWVTVWDSAPDAAEFFEAYRDLLAQKYRGGLAPQAYIERRDRRVIVVEGLPREEVGKKIEAIWQGMLVEAEPFDPFFSRLKIGAAVER